MSEGSVTLNKNPQGTWSKAEAARYLGCTEGTLAVWVSKRKVPFVRVNRLVRFRKRDLDMWLDENMVTPSDSNTNHRL
jgi:excisionase family DNA binding protein